MKTRADGRSVAYVGAGSSAVLRGEDDISTWDDEELAMGRRRDVNGNFTGKPPRLIPAACYQELKRRQVFDAESTLGRRVAKAAEYLADVADGIEEPVTGRIRACESLLDRVVGKPKESVDVRMSVAAQVETLPWVQALKRSVRTPDGQRIIDTSATELPAADEDDYTFPPEDDDPVLDFEEPPGRLPGRTVVHSMRVHSSGPTAGHPV